MAYFFLRFFLLFLFLFLFLSKEFRQRKENRLEPSSLRQLFKVGAKWQKGSDPKVSALLFAISAFVGFSLWESLFLSILDVFPLLRLQILVGVVSATLLLRRRAKFHPWTFKETLWASGTMAFVAGALFCWVLFPWVYFRSLFLKKT